MEKIKTIKDVEIEIRRAVIILRAMPHEGPRGLRAFWPAFASEDAEDDSDSAETYMSRPLASEVEDMELVMEDWLKVLTYDERLLVFRRNTGKSWKDLSIYYSLSRSWLSLQYRRCLKKIFDYVIASQEKEAL